MAKSKITFEQLNDPAFRRRELLKDKAGAAWITFHELDSIINISKFSETYFERTHAWFVQKLYGYDVNHRKKRFTADEYTHMVESLRDLAARLGEYAAAIEAADMPQT